MIKSVLSRNLYLKNVLKDTKLHLYIKLKSLFFKILQKLDNGFQGDIVFHQSIPLLNTVDSQAASQPRFISKTSVINNNSSLLTDEILDFYLQGIFEAKSAKIKGLLKDKLPAGACITDVDLILRQELKSLAEQKNPTIENLSCYRSFLAHIETTKKNENAYTKEDKIKPNAVFWPDPTFELDRRSIYNELPYVQKMPIIDRQTPIGSAGSCFASEIAQKLQRDGYNYVVTERPVALDGSYRFMSAFDPAPSCAAWGTIFNTPSFRQLVEKAFGERQLPKIIWEENKPEGKKYYDPFRENIEFSSPDAFEANYEKHREATREAFLKAKVFVITLGLNEVWYFKADGSVFSRSPWRTAPSLVGHKIMTVEENVNDLQRMFDILSSHNPQLHLIVTLSPIGLHATFRADTDHIVSANSHSKAVLRVAAEEFVRRNKNRNVSYFPSYETVMFCTENPLREDQRNVRPETVANVMKLFKEIYFTEELALAAVSPRELQ